MLAARPARAGEAEAQLRPNTLGVHGRDSARRRRGAARFGRADPRRDRRGRAACATPGTGSASSRTRPRVSRRELGEQLRRMGFAIDDDELQTTGGVAARVLAGKRVLALTMPGILDDLEGLGADRDERRRRADRRRRRGRGAGPRLLLPQPQPRLPRAPGGRRALLPAPQPLVADGRRARGSTPARSSPGSSTPPASRRPCSASRAPQYFAAALEALDADPELTWMVGDDLEGDIAGAQRARDAHGARAHGQVPARRARAARASSPDGIVSSIAQLPTGSRRTCERPGGVGVDLIEIERVAARARPPRRPLRASAASPRPSAPTATRSRTRRSTTPAASRPRRRSARRSARASTSPGGRSRSAAGRSPASC